MRIIELLMSLSIEIIGALIVFLLGFLVSKAPKSIEKYKLKKFFGSSVLSNDFQIIYGTVQRRKARSKQIIYEKKYHDGTVYKSGGTYKIIADGTLRAYSYISHELAKFRKNQIEFFTDEIAYKHFNNTFIVIGGPLVNELTNIAMNEKSNIFFKFANLDFTGTGNLRIDVFINSKEKLSYTLTCGKNDYGIILKIRNSRFKDHFFIVCAGISSWGTSGAAWYLVNNWKRLYQEFKSNEFGIILREGIIIINETQNAIRL